ncbi:murein hydrolase transporter LrgA [Pasteurellaceae bacterium Macca]|nr:murein hydrolase transporter LrgA [Pasteurellaceae bacterium Macca]
MLYLGKWVAYALPIGIPESIWGLLILFTLLVCKAIKTEWVMPATRPLTRYMSLFFLPVCGGILDYVGVLSENVGSLVIANFLSTLVSLVLIGGLAQWLFRQDQGQEKDQDHSQVKQGVKYDE